jgi:guanosine-3',5'-bis(diphosphate) 3'-pyrophosphohydrolase
MASLERAVEIAATAHSGQVDKAGQPYLLHPLRIMLALQTESERIAAVLHDVVEDTPWTLDQLRAQGFAEEVLTAVDALTRRKDEDYMDFVRRAAADPIGRRVKRQDVLDNLDLSRIAAPTARDFEPLERYRQALAILDGSWPAKDD